MVIPKIHGRDKTNTAIILTKLAKNAEKYPVDKSKGNAKKYTEL